MGLATQSTKRNARRDATPAPNTPIVLALDAMGRCFYRSAASSFPETPLQG